MLDYTSSEIQTMLTAAYKHDFTQPGKITAGWNIVDVFFYIYVNKSELIGKYGIFFSLDIFIADTLR